MAKKPSYHYRQSGVIPFRRDEDGVQVLLVTSRKQRRWVIPKGIIEEGMTAAESAVKEAHEEAGVVGRVLPTPVGAYEYPKWEGTCRVEVYAMPVEQELPAWPGDFRARAWLSPEEAMERVFEPGLKRLIAEIVAISAPGDPSGEG
jgi:8-oxo-dGTP pyrophosphatase MutT (NUDIX family)